jgi:CubicO group peptidase (beta-lactamase class C family)
LIDLDGPAGDYLRAFELRPANPGFGPVTVRQLLTHTSGIAEELHLTDVFKPLFGELVPAGEPLPSLAQYYRSGVPVRADPGTRWVYTDHTTSRRFPRSSKT